jgi:hypothetical protein
MEDIFRYMKEVNLTNRVFKMHMMPICLLGDEGQVQVSELAFDRLLNAQVSLGGGFSADAPGKSTSSRSSDPLFWGIYAKILMDESPIRANVGSEVERLKRMLQPLEEYERLRQKTEEIESECKLRADQLELVMTRLTNEQAMTQEQQRREHFTAVSVRVAEVNLLETDLQELLNLVENPFDAL